MKTYYPYFFSPFPSLGEFHPYPRGSRLRATGLVKEHMNIEILRRIKPQGRS